MSQSLVNNLVHLIYSTKHHKPRILAEIRDGLYAYQAGIFKQWNSPALVGCIALTGLGMYAHADPGRRFALPWADMFWPLRGEDVETPKKSIAHSMSRFATAKARSLGIVS